jgi:uncharacterized protein
MMRRLAVWVAGFLGVAVWLVPQTGAQGEVPVPRLERRVTDLTGTLTVQEQSVLEQKLAAFQQRKGTQIAVLIVPTTQPETIEQFGIKVAEQWKIGRKGADDGVLFLVAMDDRALRIEVGYGLEGALPDVTANRIIEDIVVPRFRNGDFDSGVNAGIDAMIKVIDGEQLPAPAARAPAPTGGFEDEGFGTLLVIGFIIAVAAGGLLSALFGRLPAAVITGGLTGAIVWALVASALAAGVVGVIAFLFTLFGGMPARRRGGYRPGGWGGGWPPMGGGGWGGGGRSGGGAWSGGGGRFGGGGASGRW